MIQLLLDLLNIQSYSGEEKPVVDFIIDFVKPYGFTTEIDEVGNVYCVRGTGPFIILNAHMDCVRGYSYKASKTTTSYIPEKPRNCRWCNNIESCWGIKTYNTYNMKKKDVDELESTTCEFFTENPTYTYEKDVQAEEEEVHDEVVAKLNADGTKIIGNGSRPIGGDDKCGIAMALQFIRENVDVPIKLFFSVSEEIGCVGASAAMETHAMWFQDVIWGLTLDRRGSGDICYQSCSVQNFKHLNFLAEIAKVWIMNGIVIKLENGSVADVIHLRNVIPDMVNVSVGYDSPHSNTETVDVRAFERIYAAMSQLIIKSALNYKVTSKMKRVEMLPPIRPVPKVIYLPKEKKEEPKKKESTGVAPKINYSNAFDATDEDIEEALKDMGFEKEHYKPYLLHLEVVKQQVTPNEIVSSTVCIINSVRTTENAFYSTFLKKFVSLNEGWKMEYLDFMDAMETEKAF